MMKKRLFQGMARWIPYSPISMLVPNMLFMSVKQKAMVLQEQEASRFMHQVPDMPQKYRWMRLGICFFYLLVLIYAVISSLQRRSLGSFLPIWLDSDAKITLKFSFMQFIEGITVFWKTKILRILFYAFCAFCIQRITHYFSLDKLSVLFPILLFFMAAYEGVNVLFNGVNRTIDVYYLLFNAIGILLGVSLAKLFGKLFPLFISKMGILLNHIN